ncbi:MAG: pyrroline-5-carboxylate reductase [Firmicutes bacterium]|nr:pyrroline-5-carboxylate reductase [Bacillota bacterium]
MQRVAIVGSGHLAHALWEGWHLNPLPSRTFSLIVRSDAHRHLWDDAVWNTVVYDPSAVKGHDVVVIAVNPKDAATTLTQLHPHLEDAMVISPIAGWSIAKLRAHGISGPLVRIMPNVCAAIGASTTLATFDGCDSAQQEALEALIGECGPVTVVEESLMDPYTALVGSGPAYIFLLLEALIASGERLGADAGRTRQLVSSMVEGAARLARHRSNEPLSTWIEQVASPGGTTEALLAVLNQAKWPHLIQDAIVAASLRAQELGAKT